MDMQSLAKSLARKEGKKSQARIGDIRELLAILSDIYYLKTSNVSIVLYDNGMRRCQRKEKLMAKKVKKSKPKPKKGNSMKKY